MFNSDDELFPYIRISQIDHLPVPLAALRDPTLIRFGRQLTSGKQASHGPLRQMAETRVAELYGSFKNGGSTSDKIVCFTTWEVKQ